MVIIKNTQYYGSCLRELLRRINSPQAGGGDEAPPQKPEGQHQQQPKRREAPEQQQPYSEVASSNSPWLPRLVVKPGAAHQQTGQRGHRKAERVHTAEAVVKRLRKGQYAGGGGLRSRLPSQAQTATHRKQSQRDFRHEGHLQEAAVREMRFGRIDVREDDDDQVRLQVCREAVLLVPGQAQLLLCDGVR